MLTENVVRLTTAEVPAAIDTWRRLSGAAEAGGLAAATASDILAAWAACRRFGLADQAEPEVEADLVGLDALVQSEGVALARAARRAMRPDIWGDQLDRLEEALEVATGCESLERLAREARDLLLDLDAIELGAVAIERTAPGVADELLDDDFRAALDVAVERVMKCPAVFDDAGPVAGAIVAACPDLSDEVGLEETLDKLIAVAEDHRAARLPRRVSPLPACSVCGVMPLPGHVC